MSDRPDTGLPGTPSVASDQRRGPAPARDRTKSARRRAREFALQGLYHWLVNPGSPESLEAHIREQEDFGKCDRPHFDALLHGCIEQQAELDAALLKFLDRPLAELSPVEHGVLWVGAYELKHCIDVPYKVAINEAVELAKSFGGTDGHKYVNGVLDHLAPMLRPEEVAAHRARRT